MIPNPEPAPDAETWQVVLHWFLGVPLQIAIVIVVTVIVIGVLRRVITRSVAKFAASGDQRGRDGGGKADSTLMKERRVQRSNAIGSLLVSTVTAIAVGIALLTILPLLGIDIAPLLTSAGVLGVALGFGAQNLVKDYLSGIFIVLEDQFGVGDTVELTGVIGTVEEVTLRVTRLRDLTGVVWYVRNGEILTVGNRSQGWTLAIADLPVAADTNLDQVRAVVDRVGEQMMNDPSLHDSLLAAPSFAGVESVSGEAVVVRVVARASAQDQTAVTRTLRERLKDAFDAEGIRIPVVLRMPSGGGTSGGSGGKPGSR